MLCKKYCDCGESADRTPRGPATQRIALAQKCLWNDEPSIVCDALCKMYKSDRREFLLYNELRRGPPKCGRPYIVFSKTYCLGWLGLSILRCRHISYVSRCWYLILKQQKTYIPQNWKPRLPEKYLCDIYTFTLHFQKTPHLLKSK